MVTPLNQDVPEVMHIDLNSCFSTIEQQANPLLRHWPVAVAAYDTPRGIILAASYEAKALGIKLGVSVGDARQICPRLVVMMPDPDKYIDASARFKKVLLKYTSSVIPKSIDEFTVDFRGSLALENNRDLRDVALEIKRDIKDNVGDYVTVNIGIGPSRFLAKLAAGLHKPDGLDVLSCQNLERVYKGLDLIDLPGINTRYRARLNLAGIYTPLDLLQAPLEKLRKEVFHGIVGYYWYQRIRGYEIDNTDFARKSYGQQYALSKKTADYEELSRLLMKLCEKTGRRLRRAGCSAHGIRLWLGFEGGSRYCRGQKTEGELYATQDIYSAASKLLREALSDLRVTNMSVTVYNLAKDQSRQINLFAGTNLDRRALAVASDEVNDRYGEFSVHPALMANMDQTIIKRIAFGSLE